MVSIDREGRRRAWTMGEVAEGAARAAGALAARGVGRGDVVLTLLGNRPEWVLTMVACFRLGAVVLPCTEQLRAADLRHRLAVAAPRLVVCDERNAAELGAAGPGCDVLLVPGRELTAAAPVAAGRARAGRPLPDHLHLRHLRDPQGRAARAALPARAGASGRALAGCPARRAGVVHGGHGLVEVGPQRVHRAVAVRRRRAAARRPLRPRRAPRARRARAGRRPVHGPDGVPRHRRPRRPVPAAGAARPPRGGRGARPGGAGRLARGHGAVDPRRLRPDGDRPPRRDAAGPAAAPRLHGPSAPGREPGRGRRRARARPRHGSDVLPPLPRRAPAHRGRGAPATASARTRTASSTSRGAGTT